MTAAGKPALGGSRIENARHGHNQAPAQGGARFAVNDPATGDVIAEVADCGPREAVSALDLAVASQPSWAASTLAARSEMLHGAADQLVADAEDFAALITCEMGKPLTESRSEIAYAADYFRWFAAQALTQGGRSATAPGGRRRIVTFPRPVGPCLLVTPWNFPLAMGARKIAPALAAGCTMLVKPAAETPLTMLRLSDILAAAGVPDGVVSVLPTSRPAEFVSPLLADRRLRKLSFTGSTAVGVTLARASAANVLRTSLELGGNAPFIVLDDADLPRAVEAAAAAKLRNGGQACTAANRFIVHDAIHDEFVDRLELRFAQEVVGPGTAPETTLGPLIHDAAYDRIQTWIQEAEEAGATALRPTHDVDRPFMLPTVVTHARPGMRLVDEEIFGPVAPVVRVRSREEAISLANQTNMGLMAYLHCADMENALDLTEQLEVGMVAINEGLASDAAAPFGGVKHSGIGREGGVEGIAEYLETTYVAIRRSQEGLSR